MPSMTKDQALADLSGRLGRSPLSDDLAVEARSSLAEACPSAGNVRLHAQPLAEAALFIGLLQDNLDAALGPIAHPVPASLMTATQAVERLRTMGSANANQITHNADMARNALKRALMGINNFRSTGTAL